MKLNDPKLDQAVDAFVADHPEGWNHSDWLKFLDHLEGDGLDSDPAVIGMALERTRLAALLNARKIKGLGPRRIEAVVDRFGTLWNARQAKAEDFAAISTIPSGLAEALEEAFTA